MKHRGIRIAILCVMSVLLALAPFTCSRAENEGGLFGIYHEDELISLASKLSDNMLCTWYSDRLEALYGKEVEVRDFYNQKYLAGKIGVHPEGLLAIIECNDMLAGERVSYTSNVVDGGEYKLKGWKDTSAQIEKIDVTVKRPSGSDVFGTYKGERLALGSPIFGGSDTGRTLTMGYACDGGTYLDLAAFFLSQSTGSGGGQTSGGQTSGGQTSGGQTSGGQTSGGQTSGGQTSGGQVNDGTNYVKWLVYLLAGCAVLALIILANTRRGKKDEPEAQPAKPEANVTMPLMDDENVTVPDDPRYRGGASGFVMLECTNGALRGASFPIRGRVVIGRDPSRCVIVYPRDEKGVSAVHCAVEPVADDAVLVTDLGSSYGTLAGSKPLTSGMSARVRAGERIVLGGSGNEFQVRTR